MLYVKSMDNLGLLWKDWRSRVQACELEGEAARSGAAKAIQFHHAKVGYIEKDWDSRLIELPSYQES